MPHSGTYILEPKTAQLLQTYGVPYPDHGLARSSDEAAGIAESLGYPVVLKIVSPDVPHKSDVGGVVVGLEGADQVRAAFAALVDRVQHRLPTAKIEGALVCEQVSPGLEVIVGALADATFGPTVMFGMGGIFAEVLQDVAFRVAPLTRHDAQDMVREIRGYPLLAGARGQEPRDIDGLVDLLLSVSQFALDTEVQELDLNPVRVFERGLCVLDARLIVAQDDDSANI
jgi:acyl-CoA synthetase (NDP forming)